ncbi:MAG: glycosyltransferase family 2 protein [Actinomycetota bacterium]|nr:glycosyltransferase family 2 protein [Actinomycetota bacterium]
MPTNKKSVAVIVPAFNEERHIGNVLNILKSADVVDEIIVVSDGSKDRTVDVARSFGVQVIERAVNGGKGAAMQAGIETTDADIIAFIDADLIGITREHIESMIMPLIQEDELYMTVGRFTSGRITTDLAQAMVPFISGQRAVKREFLKGLPDLTKTGYGVEIVITQHAKQNKFKVREVLIPEATQVTKEEKLGMRQGLKARMKMYGDIAKHIVTKSKSG